jgi:hypothetical protein
MNYTDLIKSRKQGDCLDVPMRDAAEKLQEEYNKVVDILLDYRDWEADLIVDYDNKLIDVMSDKAYKTMIELQAKREEVLGKDIESNCSNCASERGCMGKGEPCNDYVKE